MKLQTLDILVLALYAISIIAIALWVSRPVKGHTRDTQDYFLAGKNLPWWAIGASLIAANISAEQIIGMSGSGYVNSGAGCFGNTDRTLHKLVVNEGDLQADRQRVMA
jgi:Na+/proline symporter